jgi:hypothetical protein
MFAVPMVLRCPSMVIVLAWIIAAHSATARRHGQQAGVEATGQLVGDDTVCGGAHMPGSTAPAPRIRISLNCYGNALPGQHSERRRPQPAPDPVAGRRTCPVCPLRDECVLSGARNGVAVRPRALVETDDSVAPAMTPGEKDDEEDTDPDQPPGVVEAEHIETAARVRAEVIPAPAGFVGRSLSRPVRHFAAGFSERRPPCRLVC